MIRTTISSVKSVCHLVLTLIVMVGGIVISYSASAQDSSTRLGTKFEKHGIVTVPPVVRGKDEERLLKALTAARMTGDLETSQRLHAPQTDAAPQTQVRLAAPAAKASVRTWAGDIPLVSSSNNEIRPALASAPDGTLYAAVQDTTDGYIDIYRSTTGGESWYLWFGVRTGISSHNPSLIYIEDGLYEEKWLYIVYEGMWQDGLRDVKLYRQVVAGPGSSGAVTIASGISMPADQHIAPEICADYPVYSGGIYLYVTYAVQAVDYYPVMFSRSIDRGASWTTPVNVTGTALNSAWQTRPDIAFGTADLFLVFEKLESGNNQIWVRKSTDLGVSWGDAVQLTTSADAEYHARVSAAVGNNSVLIAYTRNYNSSDLDIWYAYSTNAGSTWSTNYDLAISSSVNEDMVELDRSWSGGSFHAAYWQDNDMMYRAASTTAPYPWSAATRINDVNWVAHEKPAVAVNSTKPAAQEAGIAWTVFPGASYDVYFDAGYFSESYLLWTK